MTSLATRAYGFVCGIVFFFVAAIHLIRFVKHTEVFFGNWRAPHWVSIPGFLLASLLCVWGFTIARRGDGRR